MQVEPVEPAEQQRRGDVVGQVGDDPHRPATGRVRTGRQLQRVGLDDLEPAADLGLELAQSGRRSADRARRRPAASGAGRKQGAGQPAGAGADLQTTVAGEIAGSGGDPAQDRRVEQEVLAQPLVGAQAGRAAVAPAGGSDPDVDERVPAQVAQVAAGLALELLLLDALADRVAVAAPAAACCALVADQEDVHAGGADDRVGDLADRQGARSGRAGRG